MCFAGRLGDAKLRSYAKDVPIVVTGRKLRAQGLFSLQIDDQHGAALAVRHLVELGHRRIAFITGSDNHPDALERLEGYKAALQEAGISFDPRLIATGDWHEDGGVRATRALLESGVKFTAIFCVNDQTAYGACLALFRKGLVGAARCVGRRLRRPALVRLPTAALDQRAPIDRRAGRAIRRGHPRN